MEMVYEIASIFVFGGGVLFLLPIMILTGIMLKKYNRKTALLIYWMNTFLTTVYALFVGALFWMAFDEPGSGLEFLLIFTLPIPAILVVVYLILFIYAFIFFSFKFSMWIGKIVARSVSREDKETK